MQKIELTAVAPPLVKSIKPHAVLLAITPVVFLVDAGWCLIGHWTITLHGLVLPLLAPLSVLIPLMLARYRQNVQIRTALVCCALFIYFSLAAVVLGYLVVGTNAPLIDEQLAKCDRVLGFDWPKIFQWIKQKPPLDLVLGLAYSSILPQIGVVTVYLAFTNRREQLAEFNSVLVATALVTIIVSGFFPAAGPFKYYSNIVHADVSMLSHFEPVRRGTLRTIDLVRAQGLVSMPSFHTIMAILLAYAMRDTRMRSSFLILNVAVIVSTPTHGGHYLVDLIAGAATVAAVIAMRKVFAGSLSGTTQRALGLLCGSLPQTDR
jgi:hypothetical protein